MCFPSQNVICPPCPQSICCPSNLLIYHSELIITSNRYRERRQLDYSPTRKIPRIHIFDSQSFMVDTSQSWCYATQSISSSKTYQLTDPDLTITPAITYPNQSASRITIDDGTEQSQTNICYPPGPTEKNLLLKYFKN